MKKVSREDAKAAGLKRYFTGKPCRRKHIAERWAGNKNCVVCHRERSREKHAADPQILREYVRELRVINSEMVAEHRQQFYRAPLGQLHAHCEKTLAHLINGTINHCRYHLIDYDRDGLVEHLEPTLPDGMTFDVARADGYQITRLVPLSHISRVLPEDAAGRELAFRVAMDLENLRLFPCLQGGSAKRGLFYREPTTEQLEVLAYLGGEYGIMEELLSGAVPL